MYQVLRYIFLRLLAVAFLLVVLTAVAQYLYSTQKVDFFADELQANNPAAVVNRPPSSGVLLALGDEASLGQNSWVKQLRAMRSDLTLVNSAVQYSGISEAAAMAPGRIARFEPDAVVCQISAGNDLMDLRKNPDMPGLGTWQSLFRVIENTLTVAGWLRVEYHHWMGAPAPAPLYADPAALLSACPRCIAQQVAASGYYASVYGQYLPALQELVAASRDRRLVLVVLPDKSQVSEAWYLEYQGMGQEMGEDMADKSVFMAEEYPFFQGISQALQGREGVSVVNMLPLLREADERSPCYEPGSPLPNGRGQAVIARAVQAALANP